MTDDLNSPGYEVPPEMQSTVAITTLDKIYNWGRRYSAWPMLRHRNDLHCSQPL